MSKKDKADWARVYDLAIQLSAVAKHHLTEEEYIAALGEIID